MEQPTSLGPGHHGEHRSHLHARKAKKNLWLCIGAVNQASMSVLFSMHQNVVCSRLNDDRHSFADWPF